MTAGFREKEKSKCANIKPTLIRETGACVCEYGRKLRNLKTFLPQPLYF